MSLDGVTGWQLISALRTKNGNQQNGSGVFRTIATVFGNIRWYPCGISVSVTMRQITGHVLRNSHASKGQEPEVDLHAAFRANQTPGMPMSAGRIQSEAAILFAQLTDRFWPKAEVPIRKSVLVPQPVSASTRRPH